MPCLSYHIFSHLDTRICGTFFRCTLLLTNVFHDWKRCSRDFPSGYRCFKLSQFHNVLVSVFSYVWGNVSFLFQAGLCSPPPHLSFLALNETVYTLLHKTIGKSPKPHPPNEHVFMPGATHTYTPVGFQYNDKTSLLMTSRIQFAISNYLLIIAVIFGDIHRRCCTDT